MFKDFRAENDENHVMVFDFQKLSKVTIMVDLSNLYKTWRTSPFYMFYSALKAAGFKNKQPDNAGWW
jgi:hypothetical protein